MRTREVFYAEEWQDEAWGVSGPLAAIAQHLAQGERGEDGGGWLVEPQRIPSDHVASRVILAWVPCARDAAGVYAIPEELPGEVEAMALGDGLGWHDDMFCSNREEALELLAEIGSEDTEYLVCIAENEPGVISLSEGPTATFTPSKPEEKAP